MIRVLSIFLVAQTLCAQGNQPLVVSRDYQYLNFKLSCQPATDIKFGQVIFVECEITNNRIHPVALKAFEDDAVTIDMTGSQLNVLLGSGNTLFKLEQGRSYKSRFTVNLLDVTKDSSVLHSVTFTATYSDYATYLKDRKVPDIESDDQVMPVRSDGLLIQEYSRGHGESTTFIDQVIGTIDFFYGSKAAYVR